MSSPAPPALTQGDLKTIVDILDEALRKQPMSAGSRQAITHVRARAAGQRDALPDLPALIIAWIDALMRPDRDPVLKASNALLEALANYGWITSSSKLFDLLDRTLPVVHKAIFSGAIAAVTPGAADAANPLAEAGDASGVEWFEPKEVPFILDAAIGPELERLVEDLRHATRYVALGIDAPTRVLLKGPPGVGKTTAARWVAWKLGVPLGLARLDGMVSSFIGKSERNLKAAFEEAGKRGAILFLDEIDGLCLRRDAQGGAGVEHAKKITSALLQQLDRIPAAQVVFGATNLADQLDPALRRRMPTELTFAYPDRRARAAMLDAWWERLVPATDARDYLLDRSEGRSGDYLRAVAMRAARSAIAGAARLEDAGVGLDAVPVLQHHVAAAIAAVPRPDELDPKRAANGAVKSANGVHLIG